MRAQIYVHGWPVGPDDFERKRMSRLGEGFPSSANLLGQLLRRHSLRDAGYQAGHFQAGRTLHHGVKWIHARHHQKFHWFAFLLGNFHYVTE